MNEGTLCIPCLEMVPTKTAHSLLQLLNTTKRKLNCYLGKRSYMPVSKNNAIEFMEGAYTLIIPNEAYFSHNFLEHALLLSRGHDLTVFPFAGRNKTEYAFLVKRKVQKRVEKPYFLQDTSVPLLNSEDLFFIQKCRDAKLDVHIETGRVDLCHISQIPFIDYWKPAIDNVPGTIGTPCMDTVHYEYLMSMATLLVNSDVSYNIVMTEEKPLAYARNYIVDHLEGEWLWWIDSDHLFTQNVLEQLLALNVPIAGGIAYQKRAPFYPCIYGELEGDGKSHAHMLWLPSKPFEAYMTGTGCVVVRKEVFDKVAKPYFEYTKELGEDMHFFMKTKEHGYKIVIDPAMRIGHMTSIPIDMYTYWRYNIEDLRGMIAESNKRTPNAKIEFDESILHKKSTFSW